MADLKISQLPALAGGDLLAADQLAVADTSASETKRITVTDLVGNAVTLIADATIPGAKILFSAGGVAGTAIADGGVTTAKLAADSVTAAKLADESTVDLVTTLPAAGAFTGQIALDTDDSKIYVWNGSAWVSVKGAGSVNVVNGSTTGVVNITSTTSGDTCTIAATLDDTSAAAQFLGGPTGAGGTVGYRTIIGTDLPTPTASAKGGVIVNGNGLAMSGDTLTVNNTVTAEASENHIVQYDANGLVTGGRVIAAADVPVATSSTVGVIKPGSGLGVDAAGQVSHNNSVTAGTAAKVSFDTEGHITATEALSASDIPNLDASKVTTGTLPEARIGSDAVTAEKLADRSTATIAETTPTGGAFIGQCHLNSITGDYFLWDGNVWQPIGISVGEIVLAGTYNATTNKVATVTAEGTALSFVVGSALPAASASNKGYYVVVSTAGTGTSPAPTVALNPPDFLLSTGTSYTEIDVSSTVTAQQASNIAFTAAGNISATNVQAAIEELDSEKVAAANPTLTGTVALGEDAVLTFEGATDNAFETTLTVTDPTADRTITLPNVTGTVLTTGDTGTVTSTMIVDGTIVNADINAAAEIAVSKLANGTARQLLQTDSVGSGVEFTSNVDVPGTFDVAGAGTFDTTLTVTGVISADGKVKFPAGTAAAPSFYSGTDTDTGLYFSAANEVSVATGGTQRVVVNSSGNVGIGTDSPATTLQLYSSDPRLTITDSDQPSRSTQLRNTTGNTYLSQLSSGNLIFGVPTEAMRIDSTGNVGIGTSSPSAKLDVSGSSTFAADASINSLTIGRGAGNVSTNTTVGDGALAANTTGLSNTAIGKSALSANTTGKRNTSVGLNSLISNTTADDNTAIGRDGLYNNTTGTRNVSSGYQALTGNTTGSYNVANGSQALYTNTTGSNNVAIGKASLYSNTTAANNTAIGDASLFSNTTGYENSAVGDQALKLNTSGNTNSALGASSLLNNTTGDNNTACGHQALLLNTTANSNVAIGKSALRSNTTGVSSVAVGVNSLYSNTTGQKNVALGAGALYTNTTAERNVAVGYDSLYYNTGTQNVAVGDGSLHNNTTASYNTAIGKDALHANTTAASNTAIGRYALRENTTGGQNTSIGFESLRNNTTGEHNTATGYQALYTNTGNYNTANGHRALYLNTSGAENCAFGRSALYSNTTGNNNVASGYQTLYSNTTGTNNSAYGKRSQFSNTTGSDNTSVGYEALKNNTTGGSNCAFGQSTLKANTTASSNSAFGQGSLFANTTGSSNTACGYRALLSNTTASHNTAVGKEALTNNTTGYNNTGCGRQALAGNTTGANNSSVGYYSLQSNTTGTENTAQGSMSLFSSTTAGECTALGFKTLYSTTTGNFNTTVGAHSSESITTGYNNTAAGGDALKACTTGSNNLALGVNGLYNLTTGSGNIALGTINSGASYSPVFDPTTEDNRLVLGHTSISNAYVKVDWTVTSDERDKMNFAPVPYGLDFVNQLKPTAYQFKVDRDTETPNGDVRYGFKAQDILALEGDNPVIIDTEDADHLKYKGEHLVPVLVNAVQELTTMVDELKAELAALKGA